MKGAGLRVAVLVFPSYDEAGTPLAALKGSQLLPGSNHNRSITQSSSGRAP